MEDYDYLLPEERIAQEPVSPRDASRLLVLRRDEAPDEHCFFRDLPRLLNPGDLLVLNDTKVLRARLRGRKPTGKLAEFLFVRPVSAGTWAALCEGSRSLKRQARVEFPGVEGQIVAAEEGRVLIQFPPGFDLLELLDREGEVPLPPYIRRPDAAIAPHDDATRYQTVFARRDGSVAAPTAGLHLTEELLARLEERGVGRAFVTLHVGPGTFLPVRVADARDHRIHAEAFVLSGETAAALVRTRRLGGKIVAVGTTVARVLEQTAKDSGWESEEGECDLYVLPGHRFRAVDALITNFHLPRSTLLLFAAAFAGRKRILQAYEEAVRRGYRFYSYGDAMLIL
jgi:S-adenosylmethionine:tRNA ribosyltransferase-isomerase